MVNLLSTIENLPSLKSIIGVEENLKIIDIGANPIDAMLPYKHFLASGSVKLVGFEPNLDAIARLEQIKGPNETYLPVAVGDGKSHKLNVCAADGMTSLLTPNPDVLNCFHFMPECSQVIKKINVNTVRLDDVPEASHADLLKIDIQGAELTAFKHGTECLRDISVIHTEVEFLPMYKNQPLFSDIDIFLRKHGFVIHRFVDIASRVIKPMIKDNNVYAEMNQLLWGDVIYIKDFTKPELLSEHQLLAMSRIMHELYNSFDLVLNLLTHYDSRKNTDLSAKYLQGLKDCL